MLPAIAVGWARRRSAPFEAMQYRASRRSVCACAQVYVCICGAPANPGAGLCKEIKVNVTVNDKSNRIIFQLSKISRGCSPGPFDPLLSTTKTAIDGHPSLKTHGPMHLHSTWPVVGKPPRHSIVVEGGQRRVSVQLYTVLSQTCRSLTLPIM